MGLSLPWVVEGFCVVPVSRFPRRGRDAHVGLDLLLPVGLGLHHGGLVHVVLVQAVTLEWALSSITFGSRAVTGHIYIFIHHSDIWLIYDKYMIDIWLTYDWYMTNIWLMLMLWPLAVTHFGAYHRPPDSHFLLVTPECHADKKKNKKYWQPPTSLIPKHALCSCRSFYAIKLNLSEIWFQIVFPLFWHFLTDSFGRILELIIWLSFPYNNPDLHHLPWVCTMLPHVLKNFNISGSKRLPNDSCATSERLNWLEFSLIDPNWAWLWLRCLSTRELNSGIKGFSSRTVLRLLSMKSVVLFQWNPCL